MDTKIKVPQELRAKIMHWTDVSYHDMEMINKMELIPDLESVLCRVFGVNLPEPKRGVLLELYVDTVLFSRDCSFTAEQTSALLSIVKSVHEVNTKTPQNNIEECFKYSKELLFCHSVRRPPFSTNIFSFEEVQSILRYIYDGYVRHYKLYKYIFTPQEKLDLSLTYSEISDNAEHTEEDSSAPGAKNVTETEAETVLETDSCPQPQGESIIEPKGSNSELIIEKEIREQMTFVSGQLHQQLKQTVDQQTRPVESSQLKKKTKK
ncbi:cilia- and flagella-associated protein 119 [Antennarius striatus]|uniref:cilia- and flagella-associated protein 119 n=1 Tax=Antennarius striatus TaxID=241820 RepID=UPI0035B344C6